jgi:hypothetical protein
VPPDGAVGAAMKGGRTVPMTFLLCALVAGGLTALIRAIPSEGVKLVIGAMFLSSAVLICLWLLAIAVFGNEVILYADRIKSINGVEKIVVTAIFASVTGVLVVEACTFVLNSEQPSAVGVASRVIPAAVLLAFGGTGLSLQDVGRRLVKVDTKFISVELRNAPLGPPKIDFGTPTGERLSVAESDFELGAKIAFDAGERAKRNFADFKRFCDDAAIADAMAVDCSFTPSVLPFHGAADDDVRPETVRDGPVGYAVVKDQFAREIKTLETLTPLLSCIYLHSMVFRDGAPLRDELEVLAAADSMDRYGSDAANKAKAPLTQWKSSDTVNFDNLYATLQSTVKIFESLRNTGKNGRPPEDSEKIARLKTYCASIQQAPPKSDRLAFYTRTAHGHFLDQLREDYYHADYFPAQRETILSALLLASGYPHEAAKHITTQSNNFYQRMQKFRNDKVSFTDYKNATALFLNAYIFNQRIRDHANQLESLDRILRVTQTWLQDRTKLDITRPIEYFKQCEQKFTPILGKDDQYRRDMESELIQLGRSSTYFYLNRFTVYMDTLMEARRREVDISPHAPRETLIEAVIDGLIEVFEETPDAVERCLPADASAEMAALSLKFFSHFQRGTLWLEESDRMLDKLLSQNSDEVLDGARFRDADAIRGLVCKGSRSYREAAAVYERMSERDREAPRKYALEDKAAAINHVLKQVASQEVACDT